MKESLQRRRFNAALPTYWPKIQTYAKNSVKGIQALGSDMDEKDIEQELLWELWVAVGNYDPSGGARFNAYVQTYWRNKIGKIKRAANSLSRGRNVITISLDEEPVPELLSQSVVEEGMAGLAQTLKMLHLPPEKVGVCIALAMEMEPEDIYQTFDITRVEVEEIIEQLQGDWDFFRNLKLLVEAG